MDILAQIKAYPALWLGPISVAAVISGVISGWVARANRKATSGDVDRKIASERKINDQKLVSERVLSDRKIEADVALAQSKLSHESGLKMTERAWADYSLRRDIYLDLAKQIDYLFDGGEETEDHTKRRKEFLQTARKVRIIGSDEVVLSLNALTASIKDQAMSDVRRERYASLMNAMRHDIRTLNELPAVGTALDTSAFPIES